MLRVLLARIFPGYRGPFCKHLIKDLKNGYRRQFLIASLEIDTETKTLMRIFDVFLQMFQKSKGVKRPTKLFQEKKKTDHFYWDGE